MKLTIEMPDDISLAFFNFAYANKEGYVVLGSRPIDTIDFENGYIKIEKAVEDSEII